MFRLALQITPAMEEPGESSNCTTTERLKLQDLLGTALAIKFQHLPNSVKAELFGRYRLNQFEFVLTDKAIKIIRIFERHFDAAQEDL